LNVIHTERRHASLAYELRRTNVRDQNRARRGVSRGSVRGHEPGIGQTGALAPQSHSKTVSLGCGGQAAIDARGPLVATRHPGYPKRCRQPMPKKIREQIYIGEIDFGQAVVN
jgi:hypothetical protein